MDAELRGTVFDIQRFSIHDGPGIRTCVFLKGCPLRCAWCSNPESQSAKPEPMFSRRDQAQITVGQEMTVSEVLAVVLRDCGYYGHSGGGVTLSGGEFMLQAAFSAALIDQCHAHGLTVVGQTSGAAPAEVFAKLAAKLDLVLMDIKDHDAQRHLEHTRGQLPHILANAAWLAASGVPHLFRIPVVPGLNDTLADADAFAGLLAQLGEREVELIPFHQYGKGKYADLGRDYAFGQAKSLTESDLGPFCSRLESHGLGVSVS
ncbi:MAG: radical SAM protein [Propionibacteriaceae bacterium]|jgi:pyruvate formate lyase activating enzyme|nr:radical SAM protein [Propionibacteriaceae bacterium]